MTFVAFGAIVFSLLLAIYLGKRWQFWFSLNLTGCWLITYWFTVILIGLSLVWSNLLTFISTYSIPLIGNMIFSIVVCAIYILLFFDAIRWLSNKRFKPKLWNKIGYILCVVSLFIFGHQMAINPRIVHYQVKINKVANVDHLRIVQLTDIHVNEITRHQFIQQMVDDVNHLNADLIVITGDTVDRRLKPFYELEFDKQFQQFKSKYGIYIVFGNHEYYGTHDENNSEEDIISAYKKANLNVLKDDIIYRDDLGLTLIGRDDLSSSRYGKPRVSLADLMSSINITKPVILLDHQPKDLDEPAKLGVDLMISGHTHGGQVFPINLIVNAMYKNARGMYQNVEKHFTSIVSSGYGLWGPPIRIMTRSEIVVIDLTFDKKED